MSNAYEPPAAELDTGAAIDYPGFQRLPYFLGSIAVQVVAMVLQFLLIGSLNTDGASPGAGMGAGLGLVFLLTFAGAIYLTVQRLRNIGAHWGWVFGLIVPFLNIYVAWRCLACPEGYADHKQLDTAGKVITGLFIGIFVLGIGAAVLIPAIAG